ncbi:MAG TPA: imidazole glycerol phosphate synthase subunit HisH [Candidatus Margulisbacteria bacterium]|nr:MAG: imidazole glycerol phosphate synthase, glutamine amidotransferase subunit [Candidatus Margulisbacteria bacterium GWD2_39_127]HAR62792.1 imidazole glycerol phosphate synthase subunit HisH [Candidatus Margulisiibacteriota bacterium]
MIAIIDYGMGNVHSVSNVVNYFGEEACITNDPQVISQASHLILPGVGAFSSAMENINSLLLKGVLFKEVIQKGKPFLGICLGLQLLATHSYENGIFDGFGWIDGEIKKIEVKESDTLVKLPHMGWNDINITRQHACFDKLYDIEGLSFYFVHSYYMNVFNEMYLAATCDYGIEFPAVIIKDNIIATQFHPEKSQDNGLQLMENFLNWNP